MSSINKSFFLQLQFSLDDRKVNFVLFNLSTSAYMHRWKLAASLIPGGTIEAEKNNTFGPEATPAFTHVSAELTAIALKLQRNVIVIPVYLLLR